METTVFRRLRVEENDIVKIVHFCDRKILDEKNIDELGQELQAVLEESSKPIILHFQDMEFLSSAALGKFITFDKRAKQQGIKILLDSIAPDIYEVFAITKLNKLFEIHDDLESALASLETAPQSPND